MPSDPVDYPSSWDEAQALITIERNVASEQTYVYAMLSLKFEATTIDQGQPWHVYPLQQGQISSFWSFLSKASCIHI